VAASYGALRKKRMYEGKEAETPIMRSKFTAGLFQMKHERVYMRTSGRELRDEMSP
jgi:hypothetical protein